MKDNFKSFIKDSNKVGKVAAVATVASVLILSNVTGVFGSFWRAASQTILSTGTLGTTYDYGYGYGNGQNGDILGWGYGYGYGYSATTSGGGSGGGGGGGYIFPTTTTVGGTNTGSSSTTTGTTDGTDGTNGTDGTDGSNGTDGSTMFSDIDNSFAKSYIEILAAKGIINGYDDGTFRPEQNASRSEFLKMTLRAAGIDYSDADVSTLTFEDVDKTSWQARVIVKAAELGYIDIENKNFRPNDTVTRAEAIKLVIKATGVEVTETETTSFSDVTINWMKKYVNKALELGIISPNDIFRPMDPITRAEVAKIVVKALIKE